VAEIARSGRCLEIVPASSLELYTFFVPGLETKVCTASPNQPGAALITSLYTTTAELIAAADHLRDQGFSPVQTTAVGGTSITLENRR
jgi:hypothetical protein